MSVLPIWKVLEKFGSPSSQVAVKACDLKTKAHFVLFTCGIGGSNPEQETPEFMFQLAERNPQKRLEIIHSDLLFGKFVSEWIGRFGYFQPQAPWCLRQSKEWTISSIKKDRLTFRNNRLPNLIVRIVNRIFPYCPPVLPCNMEDYDFLNSFFQDIRAYSLKGSRIFFGVHTETTSSGCRTFTWIHNIIFREFPDRVQLFCQRGTSDFHLYIGRYKEVFEDFCVDMQRQLRVDWLKKKQTSFRRVFSPIPASSCDYTRIRNCMRDFVAASRQIDATFLGHLFSIEHRRERCFRREITIEEERVLYSYIDSYVNEHKVFIYSRLTADDFEPKTLPIQRERWSFVFFKVVYKIQVLFQKVVRALLHSLRRLGRLFSWRKQPIPAPTVLPLRINMNWPVRTVLKKR